MEEEEKKSPIKAITEVVFALYSIGIREIPSGWWQGATKDDIINWLDPLRNKLSKALMQLNALNQSNDESKDDDTEVIEEPELKRCPFCDGDAELKEHFGDWSARCKDCGCGTPWFEFVSDGRKKAIEKWNRRAVK